MLQTNMDRSFQDDGVVVSVGLKAEDTRLVLVKRVIQHMRQQLDVLERLLVEHEASDALQDLAGLLERQQAAASQPMDRPLSQRTIEGVFDGQHMVAEDGNQYLVPPNYASKSKLVEGDLLRLFIADHGRFVFKQRGPIERQRVVGVLVYDEQADQWLAVADGRKFRVLNASATFFKARPNDEAVVLVPRDNPSSWAALENVIHRDLSDFGV